MRNVKLVNGLLWVLNGLLGAGILSFSFVYLLFPQDANSYLADMPNPEETATHRGRPSPAPSDAPLRALRNPIENKIDSPVGPSMFKASLKGTAPSDDPKQGVAFLRSQTRNVEMPAFVGEPILFDGKEYDEFRGWRLVQVSKDRAVFSNGARQETLTLETAKMGPQALAPGPGGPGVKVNRAGEAYDPKAFRSQLLSSSENQQMWGLDLQEIDWAVQNAENLLNTVQVSPYATGGLRIDGLPPGSFPAERGLMTGDVIRDVNGRPLNDPAQIKAMLNDPTFRQNNILRITVERAGKPVLIQYRPNPNPR